MEKLRKFEGLSLEELEAQRVELLPDREEMQPIDITFGDATGGVAAAANQSVAGAPALSGVQIFAA